MKLGNTETDNRVKSMLRSIRIRAAIATVVGLAIYFFAPPLVRMLAPEIAGEFEKKLFPALIILWGALVVYTTMRGAFEISIDSYRRSTPVFSRLNDLVERFFDEFDRNGKERSLVETFKTEIRGLRNDIKGATQFRPPDLTQGYDPLLDARPSNGRTNGTPQADPKAEARRIPMEDFADVYELKGDRDGLEEDSSTPEGT